MGIAMTALGALAVVSTNPLLFREAILPPWAWTAVIGAGYLLSMYLIFRFERRAMIEAAQRIESREAVPATLVRDSTWGPLLRRLGWSSGAVTLAGLGLVHIADKLAIFEFSFGTLGHTFVGTLGLATATSLPELVVGITAVRMGKFGLAVGNIFGSNIFNMLVLAICHLCYVPFHEGPFYGSVGADNLIVALLAVVVAGVAAAGMVYRSRKTFLGFGWDTLLISVLYVGGVYLVFRAIPA